MRAKKTVEKSFYVRPTCKECNDFSPTDGSDGVCLLSPPKAFLTAEGNPFFLRPVIEKDDQSCRQFIPIRSI